jgi:hypothetical protein
MTAFFANISIDAGFGTAIARLMLLSVTAFLGLGDRSCVSNSNLTNPQTNCDRTHLDKFTLHRAWYAAVIDLKPQHTKAKLIISRLQGL